MLDGRLSELWRRVPNFYINLSVDERLSKIGLHLEDHLLRVADNCNKIVKSEKLSPQDVHLNLILAAAYVHDMGYYLVDDDSHAAKSVSVARDFLSSSGYSESEITHIRDIVFPHHDKNHTKKSLPQKIFYVADKCDTLGREGVVRMFMEWGRTELDRDIVAKKYLDKLGKKVRDDLLPIGVGTELVKALWREAEQLLQPIVERRNSLDSLALEDLSK